MNASSKATSPRYIVVSPVRDEECYVEFTLRSVANQNLKPVKWVIVDDGSKDRTAEIVSRCIDFHPFLRLVHNPHTGFRETGSAVIRAFNCGYESIGDTEYEFIVKLDCDLSFGPDYFENLLGRFDRNDRLGVASGVYFEQMGDAGAWREVAMPPYHAAGACKVIRRECFEQIGGFVVAPGWDTVDEIRAMTRGWKTGHFRDLQMKHHKREGSGIGAIRTSAMHGEIYYLTGGSKLFFLLKVLHRIATKPYVVGALALVRGYLKAMWERKPPLVTKAEADAYRALLHGRLIWQVKTFRSKLTSLAW